MGDKGMSKAKAAAIVTLVAVVVIAASLIYIFMNDTERVSGFNSISVAEFSEGLILTAEKSGVFTETIYSTKINNQLSSGVAHLITSYNDFVAYSSKYRDIYTTNPRVKSLSQNRFANGFVALLISVEDIVVPSTVFATAKYTNGDTLFIELAAMPINDDYQFNSDIDTCAQVTAVAYIQKELATSVTDIVILLPRSN